MATQIKGLAHCRFIRDKTVDIFSEYNMNVPWKECLFIALKNHRDELVKAMKSKIVTISGLTPPWSTLPQQQPRISEKHLRQQRMGGCEHPADFFGGWGENA